jgi:hypothetical protein
MREPSRALRRGAAARADPGCGDNAILRLRSHRWQQRRLRRDVLLHSSLRFSIEHGPVSDFLVRYSSTAYWCGKDQVALRATDVLTVGDPASEAAHGYNTGTPHTSYELMSVYEGARMLTSGSPG